MVKVKDSGRIWHTSEAIKMVPVVKELEKHTDVFEASSALLLSIEKC